MLLTGRGKLFVIFFCHKVAVVTDIKEINVAITALVGRLEPMSKPKTRIAPKKPKRTPVHCLHVTLSFNRGPAKILVSIGCNVTIKAAIPVGSPFAIEKKTPPKYMP